MTKQTFDINKLRVASPCSVSWETMSGDERKRFCDSCKLNVYNFSELTAEEVRQLVAKSEGRICGRMYKRADGTVLTKDCPVGLRAYQKRVARLAGAALATILGLFSVSFGQKDDKKAVDASTLDIIRTVSKENILSGTVTDQNGAVIPNAEITLRKGKIVIGSTHTNDEGTFSFLFLKSADFSLEVRAMAFKTLIVKNIKISANEKVQLDLVLKVDGEQLMGVIVESDSLIDTSKSSVTTTITREMIEKLPH
jgi:hypothetical protein